MFTATATKNSMAITDCPVFLAQLLATTTYNLLPDTTTNTTGNAILLQRPCYQYDVCIMLLLRGWYTCCPHVLCKQHSEMGKIRCYGAGHDETVTTTKSLDMRLHLFRTDEHSGRPSSHLS